MNIHVTAEHIAKGQRCHPKECPLALALKDAGVIDPEVGGIWIFYTKNETRKACEFSKAALQFTHDFDDELVVAPATFRLSI